MWLPASHVRIRGFCQEFHNRGQDHRDLTSPVICDYVEFKDLRLEKFSS